MALLKVRIYPDPILKKKAEPLTEFGKNEQKLFDDMIETMHIEDGVGLAAPQIGISKRIFIACPTAKKGEEHVMVNAQIYQSSGSEIGIEGCLSLPGISGEVARAKRLKLKYQDRQGQWQDVEFLDFFARVVQHEMDHLNGMLLIDRLDFQKRQEALAQYNRL